MQVRIPNQGQYVQPSRGEIFGNVFRTTNLDLKTNPGILRLTSRLTINVNSLNINNMGLPLAFAVHSDGKYWAATGIGTGQGTSGSGVMLSSASTTPSSAFAADLTASTPTQIHSDYSDMVVWRKLILVGTYASTPTQRIAKLSGSTWTANWFNGVTTGSFVSTGSPKNMCVGFNGNLYICDDYKVIYVNTSEVAVTSGVGTVDSGSVYRPIWIRSTSNRLWVGLMSLDSYTGSVGYVAEWDGTGQAFNRIFKIDAPCAPSACVKDDVLHIIDAYGILKKFNGSGFAEVARLPVANLNIEMPGIYNDLTNNRWIHQRGMDLVDGKINILVNNLVSTGVYVKEMPSGVWEYDEKIGLYHKNAPCISSADWGQQALAKVGALFGTKRSDATYLAGTTLYNDNASTSFNAISYDDISVNTNKKGTIEYPFVSSPSTIDSWKKMTYRYRPLTSGDHIVMKYRNMKDAHLPFISSATWTSTTTFTSTDSNYQYVSAGNEVEIIMGAGGSSISKITSITENAGTYTITIEDAVGSGSGKVMITNYKKCLDISTTGLATESNLVGEFSTKIQVKTHFIGTGDFEVDDLTIESAKQQ